MRAPRKAYPADKADFKSHERSASAKQLAWVFVIEQPVIADGALAGAIDFSKMTPAPATMRDVIAAYEGWRSAGKALEQE